MVPRSEGAAEKSMKAIIIAAGRGSRLWETTAQHPKTLLPFGRGTILSTILNTFASIGIEEFGLVVGYQAEAIRDYLQRHHAFGLDITVIENAEWQRGNGLSVYAARDLVADEEAFLLSMSDHLVSSYAMACLKACGTGQNVLLVDPRPDVVFDLEDATKVRFDDFRILCLGKSLTDFNGIDCGLFRLNTRFFSAAEEGIRRGQESLAELLQPLIAAGELIPLLIPEGSSWIDIDTPEAYQQALKMRDTLIS